MVEIPGCECCGERVVGEAQGIAAVAWGWYFSDGIGGEVQGPVGYGRAWGAIFKETGPRPRPSRYEIEEIYEETRAGAAHGNQVMGEGGLFAQDLGREAC